MLAIVAFSVSSIDSSAELVGAAGVALDLTFVGAPFLGVPIAAASRSTSLARTVGFSQMAF